MALRQALTTSSRRCGNRQRRNVASLTRFAQIYEHAPSKQTGRLQTRRASLTSPGPKTLAAAKFCSPRRFKSSVACHAKRTSLSPRQLFVGGSPRRRSFASSPKRTLGERGRLFLVSPNRATSPPSSPRRRGGSSNTLFAREYSIGRTLGSGAFGTVYEAKSTRDGAMKAVKVVPTKDMRMDEVKMATKVHTAAKEQGLAATNVMNIEAVFEDRAQTRVVSELLKGGELFDYVLDKGNLAEKEAARLSQQVLESIQQCHRAGIAHLDVKPENFVFKKSLDSGSPRARRRVRTDNELVLIDFGCSQEVAPMGGEKTIESKHAGTVNYAAPEVLDNRASLASDLWSAGVCAYVMMTGRMPFKQDCERQIRRGDFSRKGPWQHLSPQAQSFVESLCVVDPTKRMTVDEALNHEFLKQSSTTLGLA